MQWLLMVEGKTFYTGIRHFKFWLVKTLSKCLSKDLDSGKRKMEAQMENHLEMKEHLSSMGRTCGTRAHLKRIEATLSVIPVRCWSPCVGRNWKWVSGPIFTSCSLHINLYIKILDLQKTENSLTQNCAHMTISSPVSSKFNTFVFQGISSVICNDTWFFKIKPLVVLIHTTAG